MWESGDCNTWKLGNKFGSVVPIKCTRADIGIMKCARAEIAILGHYEIDLVLWSP
jgi:hypothetical protein